MGYFYNRKYGYLLMMGDFEMTVDEVIYTVGNIIYESPNAEEIFNRALEYGIKYLDDVENNVNYGTVCLNGAYAAFMKGYETKKVCETIVLFLDEGVPLMAFEEEREIDLKNALAQYGVKKFNSAECAFILYFSYTNGTNGYIKANLEKARKFLEKAAAFGKDEAQLGLGCELHREGKVYDAEHWYLEAAKQGNTKAMYNVATLYESRFFCDWDKAGYWYAEAASRGDSKAEKMLQNNYSYNRRQQKWTKRM